MISGKSPVFFDITMTSFANSSLLNIYNHLSYSVKRNPQHLPRHNETVVQPVQGLDFLPSCTGTKILFSDCPKAVACLYRVLTLYCRNKLILNERAVQPMFPLAVFQVGLAHAVTKLGVRRAFDDLAVPDVNSDV